MSEAEFVEPKFRAQVQEAITQLEKLTSAEVVVVIRGRSAHYDGASHAVGALIAFALLLVLLFHPREFAIRGMPAAMLTVYALGYALAKRSPHLLRWLSADTALSESVEGRAALAFIDRGIGMTRKHRGILVFVSLLERKVSVVADKGLSEVVTTEPWKRAKSALKQSVKSVHALDFISAIQLLGVSLATTYPHSAEDKNELTNEVRSEA